MLLRVVDEGEFKDIRIEEGEMFLLPGKSPRRDLITYDHSALICKETRPITPSVSRTQLALSSSAFVPQKLSVSQLALISGVLLD
jgi:hypothetical protein